MEETIITVAIIAAATAVSIALIKSESKDDETWFGRNDKDYQARRIMEEALHATKVINE